MGDRIRKNFFGDTVIDHDNGSRSKVEKDFFGDTVIRDSNGKTHKVGESITGEKYIQHPDGTRSKVRKDMFGDTVIDHPDGSSSKVRENYFGDKVVDHKRNQTGGGGIPIGGMGTGGVIALIVVGIFVFMGISNMGEHIQAAFGGPGNYEFWCLLLPIPIQMAVVVFLYLKGTLTSIINRVVMLLLAMIGIGLGIYAVVSIIVLTISAISSSAGFLEWLLITFLSILSHLAPALVLMLPVAIVEGIVLRLIGR